jgi:transcriptional regulator with XRE-family HTH domain
MTGQARAVADFDLSGALRRIRRRADLSQRQLAEACAVSQSVIARAEAGRRDVPVALLQCAAMLAGLRLALLDEHGEEITGMSVDAVRDRNGRHFPAHLDTVSSDERSHRYEERYYRARPWYTVDRDRDTRDAYRRQLGMPDDHLVERPGDSPWDRADARRAAAATRRRDELQRRFLAGELRDAGTDWVCSCPPECAELDRGERPVHADGCPCGCDVD